MYNDLIGEKLKSQSRQTADIMYNTGMININSFYNVSLCENIGKMFVFCYT